MGSIDGSLVGVRVGERVGDFVGRFNGTALSEFDRDMVELFVGSGVGCFVPGESVGSTGGSVDDSPNTGS